MALKNGNVCCEAGKRRARMGLASWLHDYNHVRPHSTPGGKSPVGALPKRRTKASRGHAPVMLADPAEIDQKFNQGLYT